MIKFKMSADHLDVANEQTEDMHDVNVVEDPSVTTKLVNRFDTILGQGSYGVVYSLKDTNTEAIKEISLDGISLDARDALKKDLLLFCRIDHPGIIQYKQIVISSNSLYLIMHRYRGSLDLLIRTLRHAKQIIDRDTMFSFLNQINDALVYLHSPNKHDSKGNPIPVIIHGDLKSANILVNETKTRFVITDFDTSIDRAKAQNTQAGTLYYMAPEVLLENKHSTASDMWSFGVILYELFTNGKFPFPNLCSLDEFYKTDFILDLSAISNNTIRGIISLLLVKDPECRLSAEHLAKILAATNSNIDPFESAIKTFALEMECKSNRSKISVLEAEHHAYLDKIKNLENVIGVLQHELEGIKSHLNSNTFTSIHNQTTTPNKKENSTKNPESDKEGNIFPKMLNAILSKNLKNLRNLVSQCSDFNQRDSQGKTVLMHAIKTNNEEIIKLLMHQCKRLTDNTGKTALMHAVLGQHQVAVQILSKLETGIQDRQGRTALMYAAMGGVTDAIAILHEHETGYKDLNGRTALMYATKRADRAAILMLAPEEKNIKDFYQETAIEQAIKANNKVAMIALMQHETVPAGFANIKALKSALADGNLEALNTMLHYLNEE